MPYANPEDRRRNSRENYLKNREKKLAYAKAYREGHKDKIKDYRESPDGQEYHRRKAREYYWRYRDKCIEKSREYRKSHPEKIQKYRSTNKEKKNKQRRDYYKKHIDECRTKARVYRATHKEIKEYQKFLNRCYAVQRDERCREDAEYYAVQRAKQRANYAKRRVKKGERYSPNIARRIPDFVCKGKEISVFPSRVFGGAEAMEHIGTGVVLKKARIANPER